MSKLELGMFLLSLSPSSRVQNFRGGFSMGIVFRRIFYNYHLEGFRIFYDWEVF